MPLVSVRSRRRAASSPKFSVIDVGNRVKVEAHRGIYRQNREHGYCVNHKTPFDAPLCAIDGIEQCAYALKEENDNNAYGMGDQTTR